MKNRKKGLVVLLGSVLAIGVVAFGGTMAFQKLQSKQPGKTSIVGQKTTSTVESEAEMTEVYPKLQDRDLLNTVLSDIFSVQLADGNAFSEAGVLETKEAQDAFVNRILTHAKSEYEAYLLGEDGVDGFAALRFSKVASLFKTTFGREHEELTYSANAEKMPYDMGRFAEEKAASAVVENIQEDEAGNVILQGNVTYTTAGRWDQDSDEVKALKENDVDWTGYESKTIPFKVACIREEASPIGYQIQKISAPEFPQQEAALTEYAQETKDSFGLTKSQEKVLGMLIAFLPAKQEQKEPLRSLTMSISYDKFADEGLVEGKSGSVDYDSAKKFLEENVSTKILDFSKLENLENQSGLLKCSYGTEQIYICNESQLLISSFEKKDDGTYEMKGTVLNSETPAYDSGNQLYRFRSEFVAELEENANSASGFRISKLEKEKAHMFSDLQAYLKHAGEEVYAYYSYLENQQMQISKMGPNAFVDLIDINQDGVLECYYRKVEPQQDDGTNEVKRHLYTYTDGKVQEIDLQKKYLARYFPQEGKVQLADAKKKVKTDYYQIQGGKLVEVEAGTTDADAYFTIGNDADEQNTYDYPGQNCWYDIYRSNLGAKAYKECKIDSKTDSVSISGYDAAKQNNGVVDIQLEVKYDEFKEYAYIKAYDKNNKIVWSYTSEKCEAAQLTTAEEIGILENCYYFLIGGKVVALNVADGKELWKNPDFKGACARMDFDEKGTIYLAGALGPAFYAVDKNGITLKRIETFKGQESHPLSLDYSDGYVNVETEEMEDTNGTIVATGKVFRVYVSDYSYEIRRFTVQELCSMANKYYRYTTGTSKAPNIIPGDIIEGYMNLQLYYKGEGMIGTVAIYNVNISTGKGEEVVTGEKVDLLSIPQ